MQGVTRLLGIDRRPGNGPVIGVIEAQQIVTIDPATGATAPLSRVATMLPVAGDAPVIFEINPAADRLRFMSGPVNHRVTMDMSEVTVDGTLTWEAGDAIATATPMVVVPASISACGKPEKTAMYSIDAGRSALLGQVKPNEGINRAIGALGVTLQGPVAFDVGTTAEGTNTAWVAAMGRL